MPPAEPDAPVNTPDRVDADRAGAPIAAAQAILRQCAAVAGRIEPDAYSRPSRALRGGTIGQHLRHSLDHFAAILAGRESGRTIDYDHRDRHVPMETDPAQAALAIDSVLGGLGSIGTDELDAPVRVRVMLSGDGAEAELGSTLGREIFFAAHHAIHHNAMIGAIAGEFGVEVDEQFGKAPSTIQYEQSGDGA